jgi:hypothetical protein
LWPPIGINILYPLHIPFLNTFILLISGFTVTVCHYGVCIKDEGFYLFNISDILTRARRSFDNFYDGPFNEEIYNGIEYLRCILVKNNNYHSSLSIDGVITITYFMQTFLFLSFTIFLAIEFTLLQGLEYFEALFYINDNVYGSSFYLTTGFHGLHVIIGTLFLIVSLVRLLLNHYTSKHHLGLEFAI